MVGASKSSRTDDGGRQFEKEVGMHVVKYVESTQAFATNGVACEGCRSGVTLNAWMPAAQIHSAQ